MFDSLLDDWPTKPLWISAVRAGDGRLTWFGRAERTGSDAGPPMPTGMAHDLDSVRPVEAVQKSGSVMRDPFVDTSLQVRSHVAFALLQSLRPPRWVASAIMNSLRASMSFGM